MVGASRSSVVPPAAAEAARRSVRGWGADATGRASSGRRVNALVVATQSNGVTVGIAGASRAQPDRLTPRTLDRPAEYPRGHRVCGIASHARYRRPGSGGAVKQVRQTASDAGEAYALTRMCRRYARTPCRGSCPRVQRRARRRTWDTPRGRARRRPRGGRSCSPGSRREALRCRPFR